MNDRKGHSLTLIPPNMTVWGKKRIRNDGRAIAANAAARTYHLVILSAAESGMSKDPNATRSDKGRFFDYASLTFRFAQNDGEEWESRPQRRQTTNIGVI